MISMRYDLDAPLAFGRYKGRTVEDVLDDDPDCLLWVLENVEQFEVVTAPPVVSFRLGCSLSGSTVFGGLI